MMKIDTLARFRPPDTEQILSLLDWKKYNIENIDTGLPPTTIYNKYIKQYVDATKIDHYNSTIIAYGYSGSGKTYTINSIIPPIVNELFLPINESTNKDIIRIGISVVEIYSDRAYDLLDSNKEVIVLGNGDSTANIFTYDTPESLLSCVSEAIINRTQYATSINKTSSRSHMIIKFVYENANLFIADLAGCERVCKSKAVGTTLEEGKSINRNISSLHDVIIAASLKQSHIPYRNSKLTTLLRQSFGGDSKTFILLCCSSILSNLQETKQTLEFGARCMIIENKPKIHIKYIDTRDILISELQLEIESLKLRLNECVVRNTDTKGGEPTPNVEPTLVGVDHRSFKRSASQSTDIIDIISVSDNFTETHIQDIDIDMMNKFEDLDNFTEIHIQDIDMNKFEDSKFKRSASPISKIFKHPTDTEVPKILPKEISKPHLKTSTTVSTSCGCFG
jgi:hypothetical protein